VDLLSEKLAKYDHITSSITSTCTRMASVHPRGPVGRGVDDDEEEEGGIDTADDDIIGIAVN